MGHAKGRSARAARVLRKAASEQAEGVQAALEARLGYQLSGVEQDLQEVTKEGWAAWKVLFPSTEARDGAVAAAAEVRSEGVEER